MDTATAAGRPRRPSSGQVSQGTFISALIECCVRGRCARRGAARRAMSISVLLIAMLCRRPSLTLNSPIPACASGPEGLSLPTLSSLELYTSVLAAGCP